VPGKNQKHFVKDYRNAADRNTPKNLDCIGSLQRFKKGGGRKKTFGSSARCEGRPVFLSSEGLSQQKRGIPSI